jgi:hypothetical protein
MNPCEGNIDLIKELWQTRAGAFGMASQNYSQVVLANLIELDELIRLTGKDIKVIEPVGKVTGYVTPPLQEGGN